MAREWSLFINRFETATRNSVVKAIAAGTQHYTSMLADSATVPLAASCCLTFKPKLDAMTTASSDYDSQGGTQSGSVLTFKNLLKSMPTNVDDWQSKIKSVYPEKSSQYKALFPKGTKTLNKGKQQTRVAAVATLLTSIGTDASLATIKATIQTFYTQLNTAFGTKDTVKKTTKTDGTAVETARIAMCDELQGDFGLFTSANKKNPLLSAKYFDETLLRSILQMLFATTIKMGKYKNIFKRKFDKLTTQQLQITNLSITTVQLYLSIKRLGQITTVFVTIPPLSTSTHFLTEFGDPTTETFLNAYNTDTKIKAQIKVKVL